MYTDIKKLTDRLLNLPDEVYQAEKKTLQAKEDLENSKIAYDVKYAFEMIAAQAPNATEKKAKSEIATETERRNTLKASMEYERKNAILTAKNNEFIALRKVASLEEKLMQIGASGH